jgi:glycosyltransferase involved in cell wall biosynthesis
VRILYLADIRFPLERANGIQTMETCHALARRGHTVSLAVRPDTHEPPRDPFDYYGLEPATGLIVERTPVAGPVRARRIGYLAFATGRAIGTGRSDVVMTRDLGVATLLVRVPSGARPPVVYESHGYAPDVAAALPNLIPAAASAPPSAAKIGRLARREARVWRQADGYVTITAGLAGELKRRFGERPLVAVIPDGARPANPTAYRPTPGQPVVVGYAGHLYAWKGVDVLLQALFRVPGARGLIIGGHEQEPDLGRLRALAGSLNIDDRVTFTGLVPPRSVPELLARADILALPNPASAISTLYTSPLKLFEYLAAGRPIVASDLPSMREVLRNDVNGLLVTPGDPDALASALRRLIGDPALRERLARAASDSAAEYTWDRRAEHLEALFHDLTRAR